MHQSIDYFMKRTIAAYDADALNRVLVEFSSDLMGVSRPLSHVDIQFNSCLCEQRRNPIEYECSAAFSPARIEDNRQATTRHSKLILSWSGNKATTVIL
jgi:hypothetical protein